MAFTFGLGSDTMKGSLQTDATQFKVQEMATNISERVVAMGNATTFVDFTFSHRNLFMQRDQENDNHATFLFEYLALLRTRMQKLLTDLTAALTDDLTKAMTDARDWGGGEIKPAMQGNAALGVSDAGAARASYQFFQGFGDQNIIAPSHVNPGDDPTSTPYFGQLTYDPTFPTPLLHRVSPDTQVDQDFGDVRVFGTATIVQGGLDDGIGTGILDTLNIDLPGANVTYWDEGGGFRVHKNRYTFTDPGGSENGYNPQGTVDSNNVTLDGGNTNRDTVRNMFFTNVADNGSTSENANLAGNSARNLNDDGWDDVNDFPQNPPDSPQVDRYAMAANAKNRFQKVLLETLMELDQKNLLRDIFRFSAEYSFLNNLQIASTSSLATGSQMQASLFIEFIPTFGGSGTDNNNDGDLNDAGERYRPDLGGDIQIQFDRFSAFYHS